MENGYNEEAENDSNSHFSQPKVRALFLIYKFILYEKCALIFIYLFMFFSFLALIITLG